MYETETGISKPRFSFGQAVLGFVLAIIAASLTIAIGMTIRPTTPYYISNVFYLRLWMIFGVGLVQWIYVLPLLVVFVRRRRKSLVFGFLIAAVILLSLNLAGLANLARHPFHI